MVNTTHANKNNMQPQFVSLRRKSFQFLAAMIIFMSGLIIGACITLFSIKDKVMWMGPPPSPQTASAIAQEIQGKFNLTDEQTKKVEEIFETAVESVSAMRKASAVQMEQSRKNTIKQMRDVLSEEQFDAWLNDFTQRFRHGPDKFDHRPGPPPGGPKFGPGPDFGNEPPPPPPDFEGPGFPDEDMDKP